MGKVREVQRTREKSATAAGVIQKCKLSGEEGRRRSQRWLDSHLDEWKADSAIHGHETIRRKPTLGREKC